MIKFGLIGGTSWYSTIEYYTLINQKINSIFGNNTNPELYISSLNQKQIHDYQRQDDWKTIAKLYNQKCLELQRIEVEGIAFCANTPHKIYEDVTHNISVPILHIADSIAETIKGKKLKTAGFLGTQFSMQEPFIKEKLLQDHNISTIVPEIETQRKIQDYIYTELSIGIFNQSTRSFFTSVIDSLVMKGAECIVLGCTEFSLLLKNSSCNVILVDSLHSHCDSITTFILNKNSNENT